jgi:hypothetical protein
MELLPVTVIANVAAFESIKACGTASSTDGESDASEGKLAQ